MPIVCLFVFFFLILFPFLLLRTSSSIRIDGTIYINILVAIVNSHADEYVEIYPRIGVRVCV